MRSIPKRKKLLIIVASITAICILTILALSFSSLDFDTRNEAAGSDISLFIERRDNAENLFLAIAINNETNARYVAYFLEREPTPTCPGCMNYIDKVVKPVTGPYSNHRFEGIEHSTNSNDLYRISACGCMTQGECDAADNLLDCSTNSVRSRSYFIEEPVGKINYDDTFFCDYGHIDIGVKDTNAEWFKVEVKKGSQLIKTEFLQLASFTRWVNFEAQKNTSYTYNLFVCRDDMFSVCDPVAIDSLTRTAPSCEIAKTDLAVTNIAVTAPIIDGGEFTFRAWIQNISSVAAEGYIGTLYVLPDSACVTCFDKAVKSKPFTIGVPLSPGVTTTIAVTEDGVPAGRYKAVATVEVTGATKDSNADNNIYSKVFTISQPVAACTKDCPSGSYLDSADCSCVECLQNSHCSTNQICTATNECICNNDLCPDGKAFDSSCSTCSCTNTCDPSSEWQDENCQCHSKSCTLSCGANKVLNSDTCTCESVECTMDSACPSQEVCNISSYSCECGITSCSEGKVVDRTQCRCVCANTCGTGELLQPDCSCASARAASTEEVILSIRDSGQGSAVSLGGKITLEYSIENSVAIDPSKVAWLINGVAAPDGQFENSFTFTPEEPGTYTIVLKYDGEILDEIEIMALDASGPVNEIQAPDPEEEGISSFMEENKTILIVLVLGAVALGGVVYIVLVRSGKKRS